MIAEATILALCLYGLTRENDLIKTGALISALAVPAIMIFARAGAETLVLLVIAMESVPFAFSMLLLKKSRSRYYGEGDD